MFGPPRKTGRRSDRQCLNANASMKIDFAEHGARAAPSPIEPLQAAILSALRVGRSTRDSLHQQKK